MCVGGYGVEAHVFDKWKDCLDFILLRKRKSTELKSTKAGQRDILDESGSHSRP